MNYQDLIQRLFSVSFFGMKLGLDNMKQLNALLGHPAQQFESIHVAGTNGKGSVTKKIATGLELSGYRVGLYTSPHISCFRERIRVNGVMISETEVEMLFNPIFERVDTEKIPATFFELTTALAFAYFAYRQVDFAVIETGLGGRLDATNILTPIMSVITSISLDHTEILGNSIDSIAMEKGGIIKANIPVILGSRLPQKLLHEIARQRNAPCTVVSGVFPNFEAENSAIATAAMQQLNLSDDVIEKAVCAVLPCRLEELHVQDQLIILDVAHNPDGLQQLFHAIGHKYLEANLRVVCGLSKSKDIKECLRIIGQCAGSIHFVEGTNGRAASTDLLMNEWKSLPSLIVPESHSETIADTIHKAIEAAKHGDMMEIVVICGTFFIMSEARAALGIVEPRDAVDLNEKIMVAG